MADIECEDVSFLHILRLLCKESIRYLEALIPEEVSEATGGNARIIMFLVKHQHRDIFQNDVERFFQVAPSTASRVLARMEEKGLIERVSVRQDARMKKIVLTEKSNAVIGLLNKNYQQMEDQVFQGFSVVEVETVKLMVSRMLDNVRQAYGEINTELQS